MAVQILRCDKAIQIKLAGTVSVNTVALHQGLVGIYMKGGSSGDYVPFMVSGRVSGLKKAAATGLTWTTGQLLYWNNNTVKTFQTNATGKATTQSILYAGAEALATDTTGTVEIVA